MVMSSLSPSLPTYLPPDQKMFSDFAEIFFIISSEKIKFANFGKSAKNFFNRKKIRLQVSKSGVFCEKKYSANFLKLRTELVYKMIVQCISSKNFKNFFKWKKIQLQVSKVGVFWVQKIFRKFLETSVIVSL